MPAETHRRWPWRRDQGRPPASAPVAEPWQVASDVFEMAVIRFSPDAVTLASGTDALRQQLGRAIGVVRLEPGEVLDALAGLSAAAAAAIATLQETGEGCDLVVATRDGRRLRLTGRSGGALAWLRVEFAPALGPELFETAFDAYPHPACLAGPGEEDTRPNPAWKSAGNDLAPAVADLVRQSLAREAPCEAVRSLPLGGASRRVLVRAHPLGGRTVAVWVLDVTAEQDASRVRERMDRGLDLTLARLSDAVAHFDQDRRLIRFNDAFARLWGLEPAWLAERPRHGEWLDRLRQLGRLPETADYAVFKAEELARHGRDEAAEALWRLPQGETLRMGALPHPEGGVVLVFSDVTAELQRNSRFNQLVQVQQASLDKLTDAVAVFGADARLRLHNEAFQDLWSLPSNLLAPGAAFDEFSARATARLHDLHFWRAMKTRITDPNPALRAAAAGEAQTGDGRWLAWQSRPLPDGATLISFADVTSARGLQQALAEREAALETAERLKHDFVAAVSRELRTPLTTVLGYAELLDGAADPVPERLRAWIGAVRAAAGDLAGSVEDILAVAELDAGERRLTIAPVDLAQLLAAAVVRRAPAAERGGVTLSSRSPVGAGAIEADAAALALVLDKLVDNALAQTPHGGRISLGAQRAHGEVRLTVADTGRGLPYDIQARLFERYAGLEGGVAGLGLALVKALVELHGGWVSVESEPGRGARLTCHLPEAQASEAQPSA